MSSAGSSPPATAALTEDAAIEAIRSFFREKPFVFIGTGMSCALDTQFGMPALTAELTSKIPGTTSLSATQSAEWNVVESALSSGSDLESALNSVTDQELLSLITSVTGAFIAALDQHYSHAIADCTAVWPAGALLKRLVDSLPDGDRVLHVLTPNYDLLLEYGCDAEGIPYTNGFVGGVERKVDWKTADRMMQTLERAAFGNRIRLVPKFIKHIRLYKVHGSLNYFYHKSKVVEVNAWMWFPPGFAERVMITPGLAKYEMLQRYRQELLKSADAAIDGASNFLFLGYGFNDLHLEEYIKRKLITQASSGLIVTRSSNPRIEALLAEAENLWLICMADDGSDKNTRIFNRKFPAGLVLPDRRLWEISEFITHILGG